jgi:CheY-like chemotaxis protein
MPEALSVLFVDDNPVKMQSYPEGLRLRGIEVTEREGADKALEQFGRMPFPYLAIILDAQMPPGSLGPTDDDPHGIQTGGRLYKKFREEFKRLEPVVILSNVYDRVDKSYFQDDRLVKVLDKGTTRPAMLLDVILELVRDFERTQPLNQAGDER